MDRAQDLTSKIKSETSGNFKRLLVALCLPPADFLAGEVHEAVQGLGTEEGSLIEILCCRTNYEVCEMTAAYQRRECPQHSETEFRVMR